MISNHPTSIHIHIQPIVNTCKINTNWSELKITHLDSKLKDPFNGLTGRIASVRVSVWATTAAARPFLLLCFGRTSRAPPLSPARSPATAGSQAGEGGDGCPCRVLAMPDPCDASKNHPIPATVASPAGHPWPHSPPLSAIALNWEGGEWANEANEAHKMANARELYPEIFENFWISDGFWRIGQKSVRNLILTDLSV